MLTFNEFQYIEEGVNDPAIFKAVFLAGGPGSGKSFIVGKTGLPQLGFRVVNSDDSFEHMMKKAGLKMDKEDIFSKKGQRIRGRAKSQTDTKQRMYERGRLGLVIDGTGKDVNKIIAQAKKLEKLGYDMKMILVNTDLETAVKRDAQRSRSLGRKKVTEYWNTVQKNIGALQTVFGRKNFMVVDNSEGKDYQKETLRAYKDIRKFVNKAPDNKIAKDWIKREKEKRGITR